MRIRRAFRLFRPTGSNWQAVNQVLTFSVRLALFVAVIATLVLGKPDTPVAAEGIDSGKVYGDDPTAEPL
jgi:hypothetical protein